MVMNKTEQKGARQLSECIIREQDPTTGNAASPCSVACLLGLWRMESACELHSVICSF